ncbi:MAG: hypothetical protein KAJ39_08595 [Gammaproteobacteria bacterium]|nr:hypothetical protein [Gammaproteobacteria bacterium]
MKDVSLSDNERCGNSGTKANFGLSHNKTRAMLFDIMERIVPDTEDSGALKKGDIIIQKISHKTENECQKFQKNIITMEFSEYI